MKWYERISFRTYILITVGVVVISAVALYLMGRVPICACGYVKLWHGAVYSSQSSQHLTDWYTPSHIIHGFLFYLGLWWIGKKFKWPVGLRLVLAIIIESAWELFENSSFTINRYRETTIALDYFGDSVINSVCDIIAAGIGFFLALKLPTWVSVLLVIAMELFVGYMIRDNLTLNIIMLIYPLDSIKHWQLNAGFVPEQFR
jgi:hypothetical protein